MDPLVSLQMKQGKCMQKETEYMYQKENGGGGWGRGSNPNFLPP